MHNDARTQPNEVARLFALAFGGVAYYLSSPLYVEAEDTAQALYHSSIVGSAMRKAWTATIGVVGIGAIVPNNVLFQSAGLPTDTLARLQELGAVGDICGRFYCMDQPMPIRY